MITSVKADFQLFVPCRLEHQSPRRSKVLRNGVGGHRSVGEGHAKSGVA